MSLSIQNLVFSYDSQPNDVVLNVNRWTLDEGEKVFIQGPSGSGKSTFLNILCGLLPVREGELSIFGNRLERMSSHQRDKFRAQYIGYVFQQFNLIPYLDVVDNVRLACHFCGNEEASNPEIEALLASLNIDSKHWYKPAHSLSIGQQQRVAIARAFVNKPKLLVVDEPTSSLDQSNRDIFMELLMGKVSDTKSTLIFVSHDQALSRYFSRIDSISTFNTLTADEA